MVEEIVGCLVGDDGVERGLDGLCFRLCIVEDIG